jgi:hypothetical protein
MAQAMGAALRLLVRLCAFAFLLVSCHAVLGDYEVAQSDGPGGVPIGDCRPGEWTCNREFLLSCTKDGVWKTDKTCQTASQCDKTAKTCTVCAQAGVRRCNGKQREYCNTTRSGWDSIETCNAADECSPTHCGPCIAGEVQCSGEASRDLQVCNANNRWEAVATCETATLCERSVSMAMADPTWTPQCLTPSCVKGTLSCEGSTLKRCRQSQDGYDRVDICASPALCQLATETYSTGEAICPTGCAAGSFRCTGNAVERCAADQTGWSDPVPCPDNMLCDSETGECGAPCQLGMKRCNAGALEACTAQGMWATEQACATVALCDKAPTDGSPPRCNPPVCAPQETRCTGPQLEVCNDDRTAFVPLTMCASAALCACTQDGSACAGGIDALGCGVPVCMPNLDTGELPLRCDPSDPAAKKVEICDPSLNGWTALQTCDADEFCYPADRTAPCQIECPAPLLCNGAELLSCTVKGPPVHQADCATPTLCECAVAGTCPIFPNGCGIPQCGGTLPQHQCDGSLLQTCQVGRAGWDVQNCGDGALCYPGEAPAFTGGYCAICPTAGVVDCNDAATGIRTCSPDRLGYVAEMTCALGCLERPGASADYCAVCAVDELRCNGTAPGLSRVRECNDDQAGLTDIGAVCEHGCLDIGTTDQCAACQMGESRCMGNQRWVCNSARTALTLQETCTQACINSGIADYCGMCAPGNTQCDGDLLQTCQNNGSLNTGTNCPNGCVTTSPTAAVCAPTCRPGTYRCGGTGGRFIQQCNATGDAWTAGTDCGMAALCDQPNHECDECTSGQYNCNAGTLRSCNPSGHWATTNGQNCVGTNLYTCSGNTLTGPTACTICDDVNNQCDDCVATTTPYSCSAGNLRSCDGTGHWASTGATNCFNGDLYTCSGNTLSTDTNCLICDDTANQCDVCSPGAYSCSAGTLRVCNSTGQGYDPGIACEGTTLRSCSGSTLSSSQCPMGMPTCNSAQTACVSGCTNGATRCSVNTLQTCVAQEWVSAGSPCANGCFGGAGPNAYCGVCSSGTQCMGSQPQTCSMGQWTNMGTACTGSTPVCVGATGTCVECTSAANCAAPEPACVANECVECSTNANCTGEVCRTSDNTCVECTPTDVSECPVNEQVCSNNTCVECTPTDVSECPANEQVCSNNTCVECTPTDVSECPVNEQACSNNICVECTTNANCTGEVCRTSDNTCVECTPTDVSECPANEQVCSNNTCVECTPTDVSECPVNAPLCSANTCVECLTSTDCTVMDEICDMGDCVPGP